MTGWSPAGSRKKVRLYGLVFIVRDTTNAKNEIAGNKHRLFLFSDFISSSN